MRVKYTHDRKINKCCLMTNCAAATPIEITTMILLGSLAEAYRQLGGSGIGVPEDVRVAFDDVRDGHRASSCSSVTAYWWISSTFNMHHPLNV